MKNKKFIFEMFGIIRNDKLHLLWLIFTLFFGLLNVIITLLFNDFEYFVENIIKSGDLCLGAVGILAPFIFDLFYKVYYDHKYDKGIHFLRIRFIFVVISVIVSVLGTFLAIGKLKSNAMVQLISFVFIISLAFICYLIQYLDPEKNKNLDDTIAGEQVVISKNIIDESNNKNNYKIKGQDVKA